MKHLNTNYSNLLLIFNLILISTAFFIPCIHQTLDDELILLFASGAYTGTPSPFLIYSSYFYGIVLSTLYKTWPVLEWYSILQFILHLLSINIFLYTICNSSIKRNLKLLLSILLLLFSLYILIALQYTFLASEISIASIVIIRYFNSKKKYIIAFTLFFIAANIRLAAALLPFIVYLPTIVIPFNFKQKQYIKNIVYHFILLLTALSLYSFDNYIYNKDSQWKSYIEYNDYRQYINDNPSSSIGYSLFNDSIKIKEYKLLNFRVNDGNILNTTDLGHIVQKLKEKRIDNIKSQILPYLSNYGFIRISILILIFSLLLIKQKNKTELIRTILTLIFFFAANVYLMSRSGAKERTLLSLYIILLIISFEEIHAIIKDKKKITYLIFSIILILSVQLTINLYNTIKFNVRGTRKTEIINNLCNKTQANKILIHNMVPININMFNVSHSNIGKKFLRTGWSINSPHTQKYYTGLESLVSHNIPFIVHNNYMHIVEDMKYLLTHYYKIPTKIETIAMDGNYSLLEFKRIENKH